MSGRKEYQLLFKLQGGTDPSFTSAFKGGAGVVQGMQKSLMDLRSTMKQVDRTDNLTASLKTNKTELAALNREGVRLTQVINESKSPTETMYRNLQNNATQTARLTSQSTKYNEELKESQEFLKKAGIDTSNLSGANEELAKSIELVTTRQEDYARTSKELDATQEAIRSGKIGLLKTVGAATALGAAIYAGPVKQSMAFESSMADVAKVVDGLRDDSTGKLTDEYRLLKDEILDLSLVIPLSAKGLAEITAEAGQAGIARHELVKFTEDAAKMAVAYDTTAELAGGQMAKWRTSFSYTQSEVLTLADQINYLGDTSPATANEISNIVTKLGPLGEVAGFTTGEIAALGGALVSVGVDDDVAATGLKKVMSVMTSGASVTDRQSAALSKLNLDAVELAETMQVDATGGLLTFLNAVNQLPEAEQASLLKDYFGEGALATIAPLLTKTELLEENLLKVGDATLYAGSMEKEFAARSDTRENDMELARNSLVKTAVVLGDQFLPAVASGAKMFASFSEGIGDFITENPGAIKAMANIGTTMFGTNIALKAGKLATLGLKDASLIYEKVAMKTHEVTKEGIKTLTLGQKATAGFGTGVEMLGGPLGVATLGIGALITSIRLYNQYQEQARYNTLHFADDLQSTAKKLEEVSGKADSTKSLTEEYRNLQSAVSNVETSTDEAEQAKSRMKQIEQELIDLYPEYERTLVGENGLREDALARIEKQTEAEKKLAQIRYEQDAKKFMQDLPSSMMEKRKIEKQISNKEQESEKTIDSIDRTDEARNMWENAQLLPDDERKMEEQKALDYINEYITEEKLKTRHGGLLRDGKDISKTRDKWDKDSTQIFEDWDALEADRRTISSSIEMGYKSNLLAIELEIEGDINEKVNEHAESLKKIAELEEKRAASSITEEETAELEAHAKAAADLGRKLPTALIQLDELNKKAAEAGAGETVMLVRVEDAEALEDIQGIENHKASLAEPITISVRMQLAGDIAGDIASRLPGVSMFNNFGMSGIDLSNVPGLAKGGIVTNPAFVQFAEDGPEAAIPLDGSERSKALWAYAGEQLGMNNTVVDAIVPRGTGGGSSPSIKIDMGGVQISGGTSEEILQQIEERVTQALFFAYEQKAQDEKRLSYE